MFATGPAPCAQCGAVMSRRGYDVHACDPARRVEFQMLSLRAQILSFEDDFATYLGTNEGTFQRWLAVRDVRRS